MTRLDTLCRTRDRLIIALAPTLKRAGPNHPKRSQVNTERSKTRKQLRKQLRANADEIAACVMHTYYLTAKGA